MKLAMQRKCFANYPTCSFHDTIHAVIIQLLNVLMQSFSLKNHYFCKLNLKKRD